MTETVASTASRRSRRILLAVVASIVVVLGAGFWFAGQFQSSAQQEANAKAPAPGHVFAEVTQGTLAGEVAFTGQIGPSTQIPVTVLPMPNAALAVVTGRPLDAGSAVSSGQVLTEVNGRPLFGAQSVFSFYRDMGIGDRGPDVEALQTALAACSYPVSADGRFGSETAAAVVRWYRDNGYEAPMRSAPVDGTTAERETDQKEGETPAEEAMRTPAAAGYVPLAEILAIPAASAQVIDGVQIGQRLAAEGTPDFVLGSADLVVTVTVPSTDLGDVVEGDAATISIDGAEVGGIVGAVLPSDTTEASDAVGESSAGASGADGQGDVAPAEVTFAVVPGAALPVSTGRARVTVTKQIVARDALLVPVLAVSDRGPDRRILTKQQSDGTLIEIEVKVLGTLQGEVAVEPIGGDLQTGDRVRVG